MRQADLSATAGSVSKRACKVGLGAWTGQSKAGGPPRVLGSQEVAAKKQYAAKWNTALLAEAVDAANAAKERICALSPQVLARDGLALFGVVAKSITWTFSELAYELTPKDGGELPFHRFQVGDFVFLSRNGVQEGEVFNCAIASRTRRRLVVTSDVPVRDAATGVWRVDKGDDKVTVSRSLDSVRFLTGVHASIPAQYKDVFIESDTKQPGPGVALLPFFLRDTSAASEHQQSAAAAAAATTTTTKKTSRMQKSLAELAAMPPAESVYKHVKAHWAEATEALKDDPLWAALNKSQRDAINAVPHRRLSMVRGPPGTGKTHTIVNLLRVLVQCYKDTNIIILATAYTNIGTDNILEGLLRCGVRALRIGAPTKVREELREATLEHRIQSNPLVATLARLRDEHARADVIANVEANILDQVMDGVRVICSTCIAAASPLVSTMTFPIVVVDESSQATEPAVLCPVVKGCEQLVLFGDDYQLGPTVLTQNRAAADILQCSLFKRLMDDTEIEAFTLSVQYRMHPSIAEWPSRHFYSGKITNGVAADARPAPPGIVWPDSDAKRVVFVPSGFPESVSPDKSVLNRGEADTVIQLVRHLLAAGLVCNDIGVITPYSAQVRLISDRLRRVCGLEVDSSRTESDDAGDGADAHRQAISVYSVDGFQGREKNVIIFSAVRSNTTGTVGFLADWRRSNVMLTRARNALFVIGNPSTLELDEHWGPWLSYVKENKMVSSFVSLIGQAGAPPLPHKEDRVSLLPAPAGPSLLPAPVGPSLLPAPPCEPSLLPAPCSRQLEPPISFLPRSWAQDERTSSPGRRSRSPRRYSPSPRRRRYDSPRRRYFDDDERPRRYDSRSPSPLERDRHRTRSRNNRSRSRTRSRSPSRSRSRTRSRSRSRSRYSHHRHSHRSHHRHHSRHGSRSRKW